MREGAGMTSMFQEEEPYLDPEELRRAEEVVARLRAGFREWVQDDLMAAADALARARAAAPEDEEAYVPLRRAAHNLKGLGGSFGYDLVTEIGNGLSLLLREAGAVSAGVTEQAAAHLDAVNRVIDADLLGDGGDEGQAIMADLRRRCEAACCASDRAEVA